MEIKPATMVGIAVLVGVAFVLVYAFSRSSSAAASTPLLGGGGAGGGYQHPDAQILNGVAGVIGAGGHAVGEILGGIGALGGNFVGGAAGGVKG